MASYCTLGSASLMHPTRYLLREGRVEDPVPAKALEETDCAPEDSSKADILPKA